MLNISIAAFDVEGIFWFIIIVVYFIAQIMGLGKKKKNRPSPSTPPPTKDPKTSTFEENLKDLLEAFSKPPPSETAQENPLPHDQTLSQEEEIMGETRPDPYETQDPSEKTLTIEPPQTYTHEISPPRPIAPPGPQPIHHLKDSKAFADFTTSDFDEASAHPLIKPESFIIGLNALKMPSMRIRFAATHAAATHSSMRAHLKGKKALKKAMIGRIILGHPIALGGEEDTPGLRN
ncbi:MAG: hypothetical protein GKR87_01955 [Kiritimatiellae bacterium]|nr:hypothetical protein [Kiritimatiellia bacterium]